MSTNKASCRNPTSIPWHLEPLSNQVFSHTFRPWEFAFPPLKAPRQIDRVKDRELCSSERVRYELQFLQQDVFTIRTFPMDLPYLFEHKVVIRNHAALLSCAPNFCLALPQTSSLHPVCQQVWVHTINLEREAREDMAEGNSWEVEEVGKWVRGLRPKRRQLPPQHLGLAPESSTSPSPPLWGVELTVGEGPLRGLQIGSGFSVPARYCMQNMFLRMGTLLWRAFFWQVMWSSELGMVSDMDCYSRICHAYLLTCLVLFLLPTDTTDHLLHSPSELDLLTFNLPSCRDCAHGLNLAKM